MKSNQIPYKDMQKVDQSLKLLGKARSINGRAVAEDVIAHVRAGKKVNMQKIQMAHGYTKQSAKSMKATRTKSYKEAIFDYVSSMKSLRDKAIKALHSKDLDEAKIFDLNLLLKNLNHDIQLIEGKATEKIDNTPSIVVYGSDDFLSSQLNNGSVKP